MANGCSFFCTNSREHKSKGGVMVSRAIYLRFVFEFAMNFNLTLFHLSDINKLKSLPAEKSSAVVAILRAPGISVPKLGNRKDTDKTITTFCEIRRLS
jgi:hypothetical protein